jgi:hypothetical protein
MATVTVSWDLSGSVNSSLTAGQTQVTISGGDATFVPVTQLVATSPATFTGVPPEAVGLLYIASVQLMSNDASPVAIGTSATATFSVAAPAPVVNIPANVSVAVV